MFTLRQFIHDHSLSQVVGVGEHQIHNVTLIGDIR